ncbi:hypothetical protein [Deinococcus budaensis]|uniref:hypothetical protein n=1 Tax=Deinococcus budaensis TaxID=1665626 RepID=UPI0035F3AEAB
MLHPVQNAGRDRLDPSGKRVRHVGDVIVNGAPLRFAAGLLEGAAHVTTLRGRADLVLFPEVRSGVNWRWSLP